MTIVGIVGIASFVVGVLADHFLESKIRAHVATALATAAKDAAPAQTPPAATPKA